MRWLKSRFIKSATRYVLAGLITILAQVSFPGFLELSEFLQANLSDISSIVTLVLMGVLSLWSVKKNKVNELLSEETK